jgi:hypothetical protein
VILFARLHRRCPNTPAFGRRPAASAKVHQCEGGAECLSDRLLRVMDETTTPRKETKARARAMTRDQNDDMSEFPMFNSREVIRPH